MDFSDFLTQFDLPESIVLLEGKRNVLEQDKEKLIALGKLLASNSKHILFRSGNADGSDFLFSQGVAAVDKFRMQVITPYTNHRKSQNVAFDTINLDELNIASEAEVVYQSKKNSKMIPLINDYANGNINPYSIKAAYIIRDTVKVIGTEKIPACNFAIFYDDLQNQNCGGTGHTINICKYNTIPYITQTTWFNWLNKMH